MWGATEDERRYEVKSHSLCTCNILVSVMKSKLDHLESVIRGLNSKCNPLLGIIGVLLKLSSNYGVPITGGGAKRL